MGFVFFLVYLALSYLRPWELDESLLSLPIMPVASAVAAGATMFSLFLGRGPTSRSSQPYLALAFLVWAMCSFVLATRWLGGASSVLEGLQAPLLIFFLAFLNVDTVSRFRTTAGILGVLALFLVGQGIAAFHFGYHKDLLLLVGHSLEEEAETDVDDEAASDPVSRIRSVGTLADPNDLAQALLSLSPFLLAFRRPGSRFRNTLMVWVPLLGILYGVGLTKSRGAVIAILGLVFFALRDRLGRTVSLGLAGTAAIGLLALGLTGGRAISMDESSEGRIDAWAGGLQMLRASPVWGVGFGNFAEVNHLAAHNSFVNCFAETGLVGYFLWLFLVALTLAEAATLAKIDGEDRAAADLARWGRAVHLSLVAFLTAALFLSRTYSSVLFLLLGLGAALSDIARRRGVEPNPRPLSRWAPRILGMEIGTVILVKIMALVLSQMA